MISTALFKTFAKDHNSTMQPIHGSGAVGYIYQCDIYEPCSIISPVLIIRQPNTMLQEQGYNYAHIPTWKRYYWITDMVFQEGAWYVHLQVDVLASFKTEIGASTQYVLRSASDYNEKLIDTIYVPDGGREENGGTTSSFFARNLADGTFILSYASASPVVGANAYAIMTSSQMTQFLSLLMGSGDYLNLDDTDLDSAVAKTILNPIQYIQSVKWFPFRITGGQPTNTMFFGWWPIQLPVQHYELTAVGSYTTERSFQLPIPRHAQAATMGEYLNLSPFSQYKLFIPGAGEIQLPADQMMLPLDTVEVTYTIDLLTGDAHVRGEAIRQGGDESEVLFNSTVKCAVEIPIAQIYTDAIGAVTGGASAAVGGVAQMLTGDIVGGLQTLITGGVETAVTAKTPIPSFLGTQGYLGAYQQLPYLYNNWQPITPEAFALFGRPLCEQRQLNTLSGYIMCGQAHVAIPGAMAREVEEIESYLNGGFFYE